jgi:hypothetical protein
LNFKLHAAEFENVGEFSNIWWETFWWQNTLFRIVWNFIKIDVHVIDHHLLFFNYLFEKIYSKSIPKDFPTDLNISVWWETFWHLRQEVYNLRITKIYTGYLKTGHSWCWKEAVKNRFWWYRLLVREAKNVSCIKWPSRLTMYIVQ